VRAVALTALLALGACGAESGSEISQVTYYDNDSLGITEVQRTGVGLRPVQQKATFVATSPKGKVVDLASVLEADAEQRLATRVAEKNAGGGSQLMVVTVPIGKGSSLELFGWGVRMPPTMTALMVDPKAGAVRIEGPMSAEAKAVVARAMQPALEAGRLEEALALGIDRLDA
jgi:hypothetical protein